MAAIRVIDDHRELENVGKLTHGEIDDHITTTPWLLVSSSVVTQIPSGSRLFTPGEGIKFDDGGPGGSLVISTIPKDIIDDLEIIVDLGLLNDGSGSTYELKIDNSVVATLTGSNFTGPVEFRGGLTGSLTSLTNGDPYIRSGEGIITSTGSLGDVTVAIDNNLVAMRAGTSFSGPVNFQSGLSGSLLTLSDGLTPYLVGGDGIQVSTSSVGQVRIDSSFSSGNSFAFLPARWNETPLGQIDGANMLFSLSYSPAPQSGLLLFYNGVLLEEGPEADFILNDREIIMNYTPRSGSKLKAMYPVYDVLDINWNETPAGAMDGFNTVFTLTNAPISPANLMLFLNGVLQEYGTQADYIITGNVITFLYTPPLAGSKMKAVYQAQSGVNSALMDAFAAAAAGTNYRKGAFFGSQVSGNILDISSIGKFRLGYQHHKDVDVYLNGMLLRGAEAGGDYFILDQFKIYLNVIIKNDDTITITIRNSAI